MEKKSIGKWKRKSMRHSNKDKFDEVIECPVCNNIVATLKDFKELKK